MPRAICRFAGQGRLPIPHTPWITLSGQTGRALFVSGMHLTVTYLRSSVIRRKLAVVAMHADELPIDADMVRDMVDEQFPQ